MKIFARTPWYVAGLAFECRQCGRCCAGPHEGYVWVNDDDIVAIAEYLGIPADGMRRKYVHKVGSRYSLIERSDSRDCIFLRADESGQRRCRVYAVRPVQCRTWPFWASNLTSPDAWAEAGLKCEGVNRGQRIDFDEIETRRAATRE